MKRWHWVRLDTLYAIHDHQLAEHGGLSGIRDQNAIESALSRPQNLAAYSNAGIAALAACYLYALAHNHGFTDANKRTAWVATRVFLADNRYLLDFDAGEVVPLVERVAAGTISERELGGWFQQRIRKQQ